MVTLAPKIDAGETAMVIEAFLGDYFSKSAARRVVVGLSGGIDSALVAKIAAECLGPSKVLGVFLPNGPGSTDAKDAVLSAKAAGIKLETLDISAPVSAAAHLLGKSLSEGAGLNIAPRVRMAVLYARAASAKGLVAGTSNKSELLTGYFTKFGDGAADIHPIGDLYKTQVVDLATFYRLPARLVSKRPSAGLFPGQTDEKDLGMSYTRLDKVLYGLELQMSFEDISKKTGEDVETVSRVAALLNRSQHKRAGFIIPKIGHRTVGLDWRAPPSRAL
ncbi:MAG: NAD(+) synthase [Euryarchaeota archaeon]|nr:NAD(+) synthase [Euryarchaeota archaeon]